MNAHWTKRLKEEWQAMNPSQMNVSSRNSISFPNWVILGYIWQVNYPERGYDYEPGIPNLMSYVHGYSRA